MSSDLCNLVLSENKINRSTKNIFAVHIPRSLGACGAFFGPVISTVDLAGTDLTEKCLYSLSRVLSTVVVA